MPSLLHALYNTYIGHPFKLLAHVGKLLAAGHLGVEYLYSYGVTSGPSMLPLWKIWGEGAIVAHTQRRAKDLAVGDLVHFRVPTDAHDFAIKRVAGLPGDYVLIGSPDRGGKAEMIQVKFSPLLLLGFALGGGGILSHPLDGSRERRRGWLGSLIIAFRDRFRRGIAGSWGTICLRPRTRGCTARCRWLWWMGR